MPLLNGNAALLIKSIYNTCMVQCDRESYMSRMYIHR